MTDDDDGTAESGAPSLTEPISPKPVIVGIGASAGGVQVLQTFFAALPDTPGAAFVVIVHLDPQARSDLAAILAARTRMRVIQVQETQPLLENHVYIIPPDRRLHITDDQISSAPFDEPRGQRAPIDLFFRSLAEQHGDGFAVILTGAGADGAVGVRAVKGAGGSSSSKTPTRPNTRPCRAARSRPASPISSCRYESSPRASPS